MRSPTVADRYARAFLEIGIERANFEQLGRELERIRGLFLAPDLEELFQNPKFTTQLRRQVMTQLLQQLKVSPVCRNFVSLLVDRNRILLFPEIVTRYHELADEHAGRVRAQVTVPRKLSEADAVRLKAVLQKITGREVLLEQIEDPTMIGGIITRVAGTVYDGSVRAQLEGLRARLKAAV